MPVRPVRRLVLLTGATALALGSFSILGNSTAHPPRAAAVARTVLLHHLQAHLPGSTLRPYTHLVETLPNAKDSSGSALTDSVVVGSVTSVSPGHGFAETGQPPTSGSPGAKVVRFDDPSADWRTLRVTITVDRVLAGPSARQIVLDWPVMGSSRDGEDAAAIGGGLRGLGTLAVLSEDTPSGPEFLGLRRQLLDREYGLGVVAHDGSLSFPFISTQDGGNAATYMDGVDTLTELAAMARRPAWRKADEPGVGRTG